MDRHRKEPELHGLLFPQAGFLLAQNVRRSLHENKPKVDIIFLYQT
jgi:hypothetical protein